MKSRTKPKSGSLKKIILMVLILLITGLSLSTGVALGIIYKQMPALDITGLDNYAVSSEIYDGDGKLIERLHGSENRIPVTIEEISPHVIDALLAIEDQRFYSHFGIDLYRTAGAMVANIKKGRISQGGSTVTQQLAGLSKLDRTEKSLKRKIQEALLAVKVEQEYTKEQILEFYLNRIYFGHGYYGIEAASQGYFSKNAKELDTVEAALLAGIIQNPYIHSPILHPEGAKKRRNVVLMAMVDYHKLSSAEAEKLKDTPLKLSPESLNKPEYRYQYYIDYTVEKAIEKLALQDKETQRLFTEGYRIYTALDTKVQQKMEDIYAKPQNFPNVRGEIIQSAMVVIDHNSGEIKGLIGGRNQDRKRSFNRATQAMRQPGSAFKPIVVFGPALEKGYSPATVLDDYPAAYPIGGDLWCPKNYDNRYRGLVSMRTAAQYSINAWSVKMLQQIGVDEGLKFAQNLGISTLVTSGKQNDTGLALALGGLTKGVTPLEITAAYGAFANGGVYKEPYSIRKIIDRDGKVLWEHRPSEKRVMSQETAFLVTNILETGVEEGTGKKAALPDRPVAGKTGTTSDTKDAWFIGYTPNLVGAVWLGYDNPREMAGVIGGGYNAGPIWRQVMEQAHQGLPPSTFSIPDKIVEVVIDTKSGLLPDVLTPVEFLRKEYFHRDFVPNQVSKAWVRADTCPLTGKLATSLCPTPLVSKVFLQRERPWSHEGLPANFQNYVPEDASLELPVEYCDLHQ